MTDNKCAGEFERFVECEIEIIKRLPPEKIAEFNLYLDSLMLQDNP